MCILAASGSTLYISLTAFGESSSVCHDYPPNVFSVAPKISHISSCRISFPRIDVLYGIWISFSVFDCSKSFELRQLPGLDTSDCQPS